MDLGAERSGTPGNLPDEIVDPLWELASLECCNKQGTGVVCPAEGPKQAQDGLGGILGNELGVIYTGAPEFMLKVVASLPKETFGHSQTVVGFLVRHDGFPILSHVITQGPRGGCSQVHTSPAAVRSRERPASSINRRRWARRPAA